MYYLVGFPWLKVDAYVYKSNENLSAGAWVKTELKNKIRDGIILSRCEEIPKATQKIKEIKSIINHELLQPNFLEFLKNIKDYYMVNWGEVLGNAIPKRVLQEKDYICEKIKLIKTPSLSKEEKEILRKRNFRSKREVLIETNKDLTMLTLYLIKEIIEKGGQILLLFPEMSVLEFYQNRFKMFIKNIYLYHYGLKISEKRRVWWGVKNGDIKMIMSMRMGIFLPFQNLKAIINFDIHDNAYKEKLKNFPYDVRVISKLRAKKENIWLYLISHTPPVDIRYEAEAGKINHIISKFKPQVNIKKVDLRKRNAILPEETLNEIVKNIKRGERVLLYLNKRGYSNYLQCADCGYVELCPACEIALRYSKKEYKLYCVTCGFSKSAPDSCMQCKGINFIYQRIGIEAVIEELRKTFPKEKIWVIQGKSYKEFAKFIKSDSLIALGTKGIIKDLKIPKLSLGISVCADYDILLPSFITNEYTFSLYSNFIQSMDSLCLSRFIIQTYRPYYKLFHKFQTQSYQQFYEEELRLREKLGYPPYRKLVMFKIKEEKNAQKLKDYFLKSLNLWKAEIIGPYQVYGEKPKNVYRIVIKFPRGVDHTKVINFKDLPLKKFIHKIEVDPFEMV